MGITSTLRELLFDAFGYIVGMFASVWRFFVNQLWIQFFDLYYWLFDSALDLWREFEKYLFDKVQATGIYQYLSNFYLNSFEFGDYVTTITYFIPVGEILTLSAIAYGVAGSFRLLRWIKSFIPTIGD
jgi:hypothetical protein